MNFQEKLSLVVAQWQSGIEIEDEWLFANLRCDLVGAMSPEKAFEEIAASLSLLEEQSDEDTATEVLEVVIALARQSQTTELPVNLLTLRNKLENQFATYGEYAQKKLYELFRYYRLNSNS